MHRPTATTYQENYTQSLTNPEAFWAEQSRYIPWFNEPEQILSTDADGLTRWFTGGKMNTCYAALDYHIEHGRANQTALIYDSPSTNSVKKFHLSRSPR